MTSSNPPTPPQPYQHILTHNTSDQSYFKCSAQTIQSGQAVFALGGTDALSSFIFSLMILPNLIKIISTPTAGYDVGWGADMGDLTGGYMQREGDRCYSFESWYEHTLSMHLPMPPFKPPS